MVRGTYISFYIDGWEPKGYMETWQTENYLAWKHPERSDEGQLQLVRGQNCGSRLTDVEGNYMAALCPPWDKEDQMTMMIQGWHLFTICHLENTVIATYN